MRILGIETSCDETAAAVIEATSQKKPVNLLSNVISSSLPLHAKTGGIIPEIAARAQIKYILPVIKQALLQAFGSPFDTFDTSDTFDTFSNIDAIAITYGPGLIGSLLVGVETAKTLSYVFNKPLIPVNHLIGHIYANFIEQSTIRFPVLALIVSGGHTDLVLLKNHGKLKWLGGTRDDAAGEAFDKIGRLLGLSYPAGPEIEQRATKGSPKAFRFPRPMINSNDFDFSFSGLKTAVLREVNRLRHSGDDPSADGKDSRISPQRSHSGRSWTSQDDDNTINNLCASVQQAVIDVLVAKTMKAAQKYKVKSILLGGGVAANQTLRKQMAFEIGNLKFEIGLFVPPARLCTDNAAMIAAAAFYNNKQTHWSKLTANPELYFV